MELNYFKMNTEYPKEISLDGNDDPVIKTIHRNGLYKAKEHKSLDNPQLPL